MSPPLKSLFFFLIVSLSLVATTSACFFSTKWTVQITNGNIPDKVVAHIQSGNDDLGYHTLGEYHWQFCQNIDNGILFFTHFWWGSKSVTLDVFDDKVGDECHRIKFGIPSQRCYWLVRDDGFYLSKNNNPFPGDWVRKALW